MQIVYCGIRILVPKCTQILVLAHHHKRHFSAAVLSTTTCKRSGKVGLKLATDGIQLYAFANRAVTCHTNWQGACDLRTARQPAARAPSPLCKPPRLRPPYERQQALSAERQQALPPYERQQARPLGEAAGAHRSGFAGQGCQAEDAALALARKAAAAARVTIRRQRAPSGGSGHDPNISDNLRLARGGWVRARLRIATATRTRLGRDRPHSPRPAGFDSRALL